jgi:hypothetical protein
MNGFKQNQIQTRKVGESNTRLSFFSNRTRKRYSKAGAAILAIIILHFVSQFIFLQNENYESERVSAKNEDIRDNKQNNEQNVEIKTEYEARDSGIIQMPVPAAVPPTFRRKPETAPSQTVIKKKEPRESRAERLRRAERILTGV